MVESKKIQALLFESAAEIPDLEERKLFLDWACRGEPELRARIERLLSVSGNADEYFGFTPFEMSDGDDDMADSAEEAEEIGLKIGKYRLIRRLGEGGCGVVYLAEQEKPVKRQVALKLIRMGVKHDGMIARFEAERQALAMMDHPGIARVLDAGSTATGRPYFVMQWVEGEKITDFCDHHRLTIRQRLELFIKVCRAVQHAHQKGVIHRDLKPSNVLTAMNDGLPMPEIIDFGIATAAGGPLGLEPDAADQDYVIGTPNYMSPEQGEGGGQNVDTRSDVFSLGVLLCEILTGKTPFGPNQADRLKTAELRQSLALRRPEPPSSIVDACSANELQQVADNRSCSPRRLSPLIKGDLDAIVMKCLQHDRKDRYGTANYLAIEIQRHLDSEPVSARPSTRSYRLVKLVRRNKLTFFAGTVVVAALAAGFGVSTWLFLREVEARREQVRLREASDIARAAESNLRALAEARETCAQAAVEISYGQLEKADRLLGTVPENLVPSSLEVADSYLKVAEWHRLAGRWQQAGERYTAVVASRTAVDPSDTKDVSYWMLPAVGAVCGASDWVHYERLRQIAIERFTATSNRDVSRQILKATLIRPADKSVLIALSNLAGFEEKSTKPVKQELERYESAWSCFALELWHYRNGDFEKASQWGMKSLEIESQNKVRPPTVRLVLAMAAQRSGRTREARELLAEAAPPVRAVLSDDINKYLSPRVSWMDWVIAGTLLDEAEALIGK